MVKSFVFVNNDLEDPIAFYQNYKKRAHTFLVAGTGFIEDSEVYDLGRQLMSDSTRLQRLDNLDKFNLELVSIAIGLELILKGLALNSGYVIHPYKKPKFLFLDKKKRFMRMKISETNKHKLYKITVSGKEILDRIRLRKLLPILSESEYSHFSKYIKAVFNDRNVIVHSAKDVHTINSGKIKTLYKTLDKILTIIYDISYELYQELNPSQ